jgi:N-acylneuraminate cytidylyltransferase
MSNKCLAIITARGGSKRIPRKNIKNFLGVPIIKYSIDAALQAGCFDEVMVSTDDKEIAEISVSYGAKVPFMRSETTSNDKASTADVVEEVLYEFGKLGKTFKYCCCIYPTAPFVSCSNLIKGFEILKERGRFSDPGGAF